MKCKIIEFGDFYYSIYFLQSVPSGAHRFSSWSNKALTELS